MSQVLLIHPWSQGALEMNSSSLQGFMRSFYFGNGNKEQAPHRHTDEGYLMIMSEFRLRCFYLQY